MKRRVLSVFLALCMMVSVMSAMTVTASAASITDSNVFLKQSTNKTCTLTSITMMLRRHAILDKDAGWASITESAVKKVGWASNGAVHNFSYRGMSVKFKWLESSGYKTVDQKKAYFKNIIREYPEGFVIWNNGKDPGGHFHAVLITGYNSDTDTFYCADPATGKGNIPLTSSTMAGKTQNDIISYIGAIWWIAKGTQSTGAGTDTSTSTTNSSSNTSNNSSSSNKASTLNINLTTKPTTITQGNSFGLYGTVSSNYKITKVQGSVVNASGKTVLSTTDTPNSTSMNINTANLNKKLTFNTLPAGKYTLKIVATDSKKSVDLTQSFTVVKTTLKINLTSYPTSIKKGSAYGLRGTVSSNAKITKVQGYVINSSGKTVLSSTDTPNKTSMDIRTANLNNKLAFNKLAVGTYTMKVVATDTSGNSVTWSKTFKVTK